MGYVQRRLSKNISDYFRGGCQGTWWLVGTSAFVSGISAYTFTAAAGVAFQSGWSCLIIYIANTLGFLIGGLWFAPWFRQLRVITVPDIIYLRFGRFTQQFYAWISVLKYTLLAGLPLYSLAVFCSAVFGVNINLTIIVIGSVVVSYSVFGGKWAVMSNDFLQSLVLFTTSILVTVLCLHKIGGIDGFLEQIHQKGLEHDFKMFANAGDFPGNSFTWVWAVAIFFNATFVMNSIYSAPKFFAAKDGKEARKASFLAAALMFICTAVFFFPPMIARILFEQQVNAVDITKPAEAAYAVISMNVLPNGLLGLVLVAMFAATMSSMDTGINGTAGIVVKNIYPVVANIFSDKKPSEKALLLMSRLATLLIGCFIILFALVFAANKQAGIFELTLKLTAMIGVPLVIPMLLCLLIRKVPSWAALATVFITIIPNVIGFFSKDLFGQEWSFQQKFLTNLFFGSSVFLCTAPFWRWESEAYKKKVDNFFALMHKPVDFEKEVGKSLDSAQFKTVGSFVLALGIFICLLLLVPNEPWGKICICFVAGFISMIGTLFLYLSHRVSNREKLENSKTSEQSVNV